MPIPKPNPEEKQQAFIARCMGDKNMQEYPQDQRAAICYGEWEKHKKEGKK